jgi:transcriptional regulator with XRE-family HTH domain
MTPAEFTAAREKLGLSKEALARILGVSSGRTVRWWESGGRPVTGPVALAMRLLLERKEAHRRGLLRVRSAPQHLPLRHAEGAHAAAVARNDPDP